MASNAWVDLYWLPLGAGGHVVRWNGRVYETLVARREHRAPAPLFHSAMLITSGDTTYAVEMGPVWNVAEPERGAVCQGPVGARWLGRFRAFQYEVRCWPGGRIPDLAEAVDSPVRISDDHGLVTTLLGILPTVPPLTWGRDELATGDMWNSNSLVAWSLARVGVDLADVRPPRQGRAPGWHAGLVLAQRQDREPTRSSAVVAAT